MDLNKVAKFFGSTGGKNRQQKQTEVWPLVEKKYVFNKIIGAGKTATVYSAFCKSKKKNCAIKRIAIKDEGQRILAFKEIEVMKACKHENTVKFFASFTVHNELWLVMSLAEGGSLSNIIKYKMQRKSCIHGVLNEEIIATVLKDVLKGLDYLHSSGLIHRDIKAANIFVNIDGTVQIGDFGFSAKIPAAEAPLPRHLLYRRSGTLLWMAPEVLAKYIGYYFEIDIWSLGITVFEMVTGRPPYAGHPRNMAIKLILQNKPPTLDNYENRKRVYYKFHGRSIRNMMANCLQKKPAKRSTAAELLRHPFLKKAKDKEFLVEHLLKWAPCLNLRVAKSGYNDKTPEDVSEWQQLSSVGEEDQAFLEE